MSEVFKVLAATRDYDLALITNFLGGFWFYDAVVEGLVGSPSFLVVSKKQAVNIFSGLSSGVNFEALREEQQGKEFDSLLDIFRWIRKKQKEFQAQGNDSAPKILLDSDNDNDRLRASYGLPPKEAGK